MEKINIGHLKANSIIAKHIATILIGLTFACCNNSVRSVDTNNLHAVGTIKQVSDNESFTYYLNNSVYIGQKIGDFLSSVQQLYDVKKETIFLEGDGFDIYNVYENGQVLFAVEPDIDKPDIAWRIWIYSREIKTEKGIGVGSTLADIKANYQIENIGTEEGLNVQVEDITVGFLLDNSKGLWDNMENEKVFKEIPIREMIIWGTQSYLTLDKKVKTN